MESKKEEKRRRRGLYEICVSEDSFIMHVLKSFRPLTTTELT